MYIYTRSTDAMGYQPQSARHGNEASAADQFLDATTAESLDTFGVASTEAGALFPIRLETCLEYALMIGVIKHGQKISMIGGFLWEHDLYIFF